MRRALHGDIIQKHHTRDRRRPPRRLHRYPRNAGARIKRMFDLRISALPKSQARHTPRATRTMRRHQPPTDAPTRRRAHHQHLPRRHRHAPPALDRTRALHHLRSHLRPQTAHAQPMPRLRSAHVHAQHGTAAHSIHHLHGKLHFYLHI